MKAQHFAATPHAGRRLLVSLASTVLLASGCSNLVGTAPSGVETSGAAKFSGHVHGGNQPVSGATVNLYFAGQNGTATSATLVATTTSANDGAGSFSFTKLPSGGTNTGTTDSFSCPTGGGSPYVYVVARGGNTLNTPNSTASNPASVFLAPVGLCTGLNGSTYISMSEAVTAATVAAVHQYMNVATGDIGSDGILTSYDGLANSFSLVSNMVNLATGQTTASTTLTGSVAGVTVTATPEQSKLNQVANILSACVNTPNGANGGTNPNACDVLFANAVPPASASTTSTPGATFSPATDVVQAAYYMFTNLTSSSTANLTALYNLSPGASAPYQPTLTAVPSDWSIGIRYAATGTCGASTAALISNPYDLNVDGLGNIWIANNQTGGSGLAELTSNGYPMTCVPIGGASLGGTIDSSGNIWVGDRENNVIYRYDPTGATGRLAFPTPAAPFAMAADGSGNVYFSSLPSTSPTVVPATVWKITGGATALTAVVPLAISTNVGSVPARLLVDANNAIWVSARDVFVSLISPAVSGVGLLNGYLTTHVTTPTPSYGLAVTADSGITNSLYVSSQEGSSMLNQLVGSGTNYSTGTGFPTAANAGGLNVPSAIALDGAYNVWAANDQPTSGTNLGLVSEFSKAGTSLSTDGTVSGGYQKSLASFLHGRTIAVDQSGNVWVGNDGSNAVTEIVGGGVGIYQPFAVGLKNGRFQTKP